MRRLIILILCVLSFNAFSEPPEPPLGFRWVLNLPFSDEFNGTELDGTKWRDYFDGWQGRTPARFKPYTVSVSDGNMQIKNGVLSPAEGNYTIAGGAVQSLSDQAYYGYYECRFKASRIMMSTTFWLSNRKVKLDETSCTTDTYSQELDISEVVGASAGKFEENMNSNTHYRHVPCGENQEIFYSNGTSSKLDSKVWEDYHTYACWWVDANSAKFYADDEFTASVDFNTTIDDTDPFDRPMKVNMVTETYDWATPYPSADDLNNDAINTSYYDWIRSYELVRVDEEVADQPSALPEIYDEQVEFIGEYLGLGTVKEYGFLMTYQANTDRDIYLVLKDRSGNVIGETVNKVLAGYGKRNFSLTLEEVPAEGNYTLSIDIKPIDGDEVISSKERSIVLGDVLSVDESEEIIFFPNPVSDQITINDAPEDAQYKIYDLMGSRLVSSKIKNQTIDVSSLESGIYFLKVGDGVIQKFIKK
ncbi:MAG: T9SS type A sorting domain-containing protein [Cyclobacteriaceae bacterium]